MSEEQILILHPHTLSSISSHTKFKVYNKKKEEEEEMGSV